MTAVAPDTGDNNAASPQSIPAAASALIGLAFFVLMYLAGDYLSTRFALPIPGSIIGLGLTLCLLMLRGKVDPALNHGAGPLLRYLPLMLAPIGAGLIQLRNNHAAGLWKLLVVLFLAAIIGIIGSAKIMEGAFWLQRSFLRRSLPRGPSSPRPADLNSREAGE